jgi:hypothetical protein
MGSIISMLFRLLRIYGSKLISILYKLFKAQLRAMLWKYGLMVSMVALTIALAYLVFR